MKLYNFNKSPNPLKVRMALNEIGLSYENIEINLFMGDQRKAEFLSVNSMGKVPVLQDGELTLTESNAILCYLGKEYGNQLWPKVPQEEAAAMQWLFFEAVHMAPNFGPIWFNKFGMPKVGGKTAPMEKLKKYRENTEWALLQLDQRFSKSQFILGDEFSLIDCSVGVQVATLNETLLTDNSQWPHVYAYKNRILRRKSWMSSKGSAIWDEKLG